MNDKLSSKIEKATVTLIENIGRGALIKNNMILTASHCVNYDLLGEMSLAEGVNNIEEINTWSGNLKVQPLSIDAISDIAILGSLDSQDYDSDYDLFEEFCKNTPPMNISRRELKVNEKLKIHVYTHELKWISGFGEISFPGSHSLLLYMDDPLIPGTSGSGIYDEKGELVGIFNKTSPERNFGMATRPLLALPLWICRKI
jgi:hypothetical protein